MGLARPILLTSAASLLSAITINAALGPKEEVEGTASSELIYTIDRSSTISSDAT